MTEFLRALLAAEPSRRVPKGRGHQFRPRIEPLETRLTPATIVLNATALSFVDLTGTDNKLTVAVDATTNSYIFSDSADTILVDGASAAVTGIGTNLVTIPRGEFGSLIYINLGDGA